MVPFPTSGGALHLSLELEDPQCRCRLLQGQPRGTDDGLSARRGPGRHGIQDEGGVRVQPVEKPATDQRGVLLLDGVRVDGAQRCQQLQGVVGVGDADRPLAQEAMASDRGHGGHGAGDGAQLPAQFKGAVGGGQGS